jgi:hypothetical protein
VGPVVCEPKFDMILGPNLRHERGL